MPTLVHETALVLLKASQLLGPPSVQRYIMLDQLGVSATVLVALGMYGRMYS
jgi:hypothetical protein